MATTTTTATTKLLLLLLLLVLLLTSASITRTTADSSGGDARDLDELPLDDASPAAKWRAMTFLSPTASAKEVKFVWWAARNGAGVRGDLVEWPRETKHGRGVVAKRDIPVDTEVFSVPVRLTMSSLMIPVDLEAFVLKPFLKELNGTSLKGEEHDVSLTVFIALERRKGPASFWAPYLDTLPETYPGPLNWDDNPADVAELQFSDAMDTAKSQQERIRDLHERLKRFTWKNRKMMGDVYDITLEDIRWARDAIRTRAFSFAWTKEQADAAGLPHHPDALGLVPFMDLLSHSKSRDGKFRSAIEPVTCRSALEFTKAGEEAFNNYGHSDSFSSLMWYDFVPYPNPEDEFEISISYHGLESELVDPVARKLVPEPYPVTINWKWRRAALFSMRRALGSYEHLLEHSLPETINVDLSRSAAELPLKLLRVWVRRLRAAEKLLPTSLVEDALKWEALSSSGDTSPAAERLSLALRFRLGRKALLSAYTCFVAKTAARAACFVPRVWASRARHESFSFGLGVVRDGKECLGGGASVVVASLMDRVSASSSS